MKNPSILSFLLLNRHGAGLEHNKIARVEQGAEIGEHVPSAAQGRACKGGCFIMDGDF